MKRILISGTFLLLLSSCGKENTWGPVPQLEYIKHTKDTDSMGIDNLVTFTFSFKDGDGDIGLDEKDTLPPFEYTGPNYNNLLIECIGKFGDTIRTVILPNNAPFRLDSRLPNLTPTGPAKAIDGEFNIPVGYPGSNTIPEAIQLKVVLIDRSLNRSQEIITPLVPVKW